MFRLDPVAIFTFDLSLDAGEHPLEIAASDRPYHSKETTSGRQPFEHADRHGSYLHAKPDNPDRCGDGAQLFETVVVHARENTPMARTSRNVPVLGGKACCAGDRRGSSGSSRTPIPT